MGERGLGEGGLGERLLGERRLVEVGLIISQHYHPSVLALSSGGGGVKTTTRFSVTCSSNIKATDLHKAQSVAAC